MLWDFGGCMKTESPRPPPFPGYSRKGGSIVQPVMAV